MSTATNPITEQPTAQQDNRERKPGEKLSASEEILRLKRQNRELERGGHKKTAEGRISELIAKVKSLEGEHEFLRQHNDELLDKLAAFEIAESARKQAEQETWDNFYASAEAVRGSSPEFAEALRRIASIPHDWLHEIVRMPNPCGFVLYLGLATQFLEYLRELKPEAAVKRLRQCGYDMHHKLPKFQEAGK